MKVFEKERNRSSKAIVRQLSKESESQLDNLNLSPRLQEFVLNYRSGGCNAAIEQLKIDGYPIIEKNEDGSYEAIFIYIGNETTKNVVIVTEFSNAFLGEENRFDNVANTHIWYKSFNIDPQVHCSYFYLINVPEFALSRENKNISMTLLPEPIPDPLNTNLLQSECSIIKMPLAQQSDYVLDEASSVARTKKEFDFRYTRSHFLEACSENNYEIADDSLDMLLYKIKTCDSDWLDGRDLRQLFNFDENNQSLMLNKIAEYIKNSGNEKSAEQLEFLNLKTQIEKIVQNILPTSQILQHRIFSTLEPVITKMQNQEVEYWFNVFTPKNFNPTKKHPVILIFDGYANFHHTTVQFTLDKLTEAGKLDDMVLVFMEAERSATQKFTVRKESLGESDHFPDILKDKLLPYLQKHFNVSQSAQDTYVYGQSLGSVAAMNCAIRHPLIFGNVLSHSGAFQYHRLEEAERKEDRRKEAFLAKLKELETPEKIEQLKKVNFYLTVGEFEYRNTPDQSEIGLGGANAHLVEHMKAKGYHIEFCKQRGTGHDYAAWRVQFPEDILKLIAMKPAFSEALQNKSSVCPM